MPPALSLKIERARRAFVVPLQDAESRVAALRQQFGGHAVKPAGPASPGAGPLEPPA